MTDYVILDNMGYSGMLAFILLYPLAHCSSVKVMHLLYEFRIDEIENGLHYKSFEHFMESDD